MKAVDAVRGNCIGKCRDRIVQMLNFRIHMAKGALARAINRTRAITVRIGFARV